MKKFMVAAVTALMLAGCSTTVPVNYIPSPVIQGNGAVTTGKFVYAPARRNEVKPNQFQKAASIGQMYLSENIDDLIKDSLRKELISSGFNVDSNDGITISGTVDKFLYDWVGFTEMDMYLDISYSVTNNGAVIYETTIKSHKAFPKSPAYDSEAARSIISDNISKMLMELRSKKLI